MFYQDTRHAKTSARNDRGITKKKKRRNERIILFGIKVFFVRYSSLGGHDAGFFLSTSFSVINFDGAINAQSIRFRAAARYFSDIVAFLDI